MKQKDGRPSTSVGDSEVSALYRHMNGTSLDRHYDLWGCIGGQ